MIDDKEQYQNKNNIPSVFVSENEDVYNNEEDEYMFGDDEDEIEDNEIIDFGE